MDTISPPTSRSFGHVPEQGHGSDAARAAVAGRARGSTGLLLVAMLAAATAACTTTTVVRREGEGRGGSTVSRPAPPKPGTVVTVRKGETLYRIATRHGLSPLDVATWNGISAPYTIYPGQRLRLSAPADTPRSGGATASTPPKPGTSGPSTRPVTGGAATGGTTGATTRPTTPAPSPPAAPPNAPFKWEWPADGALLQRYAAGDPTRQGIAIAGNGGEPVRAAADGVVVYSGAGLIGYGELIIVKHDEQWLSAYAHNRARLVNEGQRVKAGERIAELGRTGAARDMLRFEIRYNGKPQDPLLYLPKR